MPPEPLASTPSLWATGVVAGCLLVSLVACLCFLPRSYGENAAGFPNIKGTSGVAAAATFLVALVNSFGVASLKTPPYLMQKPEYSLLSVAFPALLGISVALFALMTSDGQSSRLMFFLTVINMLWAAIGETILLLMELYEFQRAGILSVISSLCFSIPAVLLVPGLFARLRAYGLTPSLEQTDGMPTKEWKLL